MDSLYPWRSFYLEDKKVSKKVSKAFKIFILEVVVLDVVEVDSLPDSQVVLDSYPPSIAVLDPETLDWVDPAIAFDEHTNSVSIKNEYKYFINFHKLLSTVVFV